MATTDPFETLARAYLEALRVARRQRLDRFAEALQQWLSDLLNHVVPPDWQAEIAGFVEEAQRVHGLSIQPRSIAALEELIRSRVEGTGPFAAVGSEMMIGAGMPPAQAAAQPQAAASRPSAVGRRQHDLLQFGDEWSHPSPLVAFHPRGIPQVRWEEESYARWLNSLETRPATGGTPQMGFQRGAVGPTEYHVHGMGDKQVWADGIEGTRIIDAKMVIRPKSSPQLGTAPRFIAEYITDDWRDEFGRMKNAILDPKNPLRSVEVRVDSEASVSFWESFLSEQKIPGKVVVAGGITPPTLEAPAGLTARMSGFVRNNAAALRVSAAVSALQGVSTAIIHLGENIALESVTNPDTDPMRALELVKYLRNRFEDAHSGLGYAVGKVLSGSVAAAQREESDGRKWLAGMERYWEGRETELRARLPKAGLEILGDVRPAIRPGIRRPAD